MKRVLRAEQFNINKKTVRQTKNQNLEELENKYEPIPNKWEQSKRRRSRKQKAIEKKKREEKRRIRVYEYSLYQQGTCGSSP